MQLIERYLNAIKRFLPQEQQADILAELSEDIRSQIEDREAEAGRKLDEDEIAAILKERGHPMIVASRYLPRQHLIGPGLFPAYRFVLKLTLVWLLVPGFLFIAGPILLLTSPDPGHALLRSLWTLPSVALTTFAWVTLVFALLEKWGPQAHSLNRWDPRKLPAISEKPKPERSQCAAITDLVAGIAWAAGWVYLVRFQPSLNLHGVQIALAEVWRDLFLPVLAVFLTGALGGLVGLLQPARTRLRCGLRLAADSAALVLIGMLWNAGSWIDAVSPNAAAGNVAQTLQWTNFGIRIALITLALAVIVEGGREVLRIFGKKVTHSAAVIAA